ncbi:YidH family protein [Defluviimonas sp. SAOS-178_SWC]|uniref:YidH family protein n=1 Tax=Defluviimonas sp. SAOS-178_SWC TaxID=3121287 RepID=UPI0032217771
MIRNYTDHSANERTFLAWVRTAVAIVGFGLAAERLRGGPPNFWSEMTLLISGALVVLIAYVRMRSLRRRITLAEEFDDEALPADTLLLLLVIALFGMLAMFAVNVS